MATAKVNRAITFEATGSIITFKSGNGDTFALDMSGMSREARDMAVTFGVARKVVNAAALDAGSTVAEKWAEVLVVAERLASGGSWNGAAREKGASEGGLVIEALMRAYNDTREKAELAVTKLMAKKGIDRKACLKLWASTEKVGGEIAAIKAERAAKIAASANLDADELMREATNETD
jgi:hypothetical protein